ncbi:MAG: valine--tRNA ligase [Oscillospiraceae bacterium]|nr:valine--tRNA ligase [Oscillospiraceae bacterium]
MMEKTYDPKQVEPKIYKMWLDGGYFHADENDNTRETFTIAMPPPNVTSQLHYGHAFEHAMIDVIIRHKRMQGYNTLWMPGIDHAGIATQIRVEEFLRKEQGVTRHDLGREKFLEHVWEWKNKYGDRIIEQSKLLGTSCDWERTRFTMDEGCSKAVREVFVRLYEQGLIYKGDRIINWCPKCTTALSDAEVEHEESEGKLWHIKYPIKCSGEFLTVATTRPETMLGDTAVAVNPNDERYKHLVGKTVVLPLTDREIPIVADEYVETEFGTGCVKITPCHDPNDFEVALRHDLERILVLDENACVNENGGKYKGLTREKARLAVIKDLTDLGLLEKTETHIHNVGHCDRCKTICEPISSKQWFVRMKKLAAPAIECVKSGEVRFVPERFSKVYLNWMENVRDWCVSRQLWWGHRIPAFICQDCGEIIVAREDPAACGKCGSVRLEQESDVLDTWFSSALWPFATLGWPDETPALQRFYPTQVMVMGYEIIFLWGARMIFSGINYLGKPPFHTVVIHGMVRDSEGRKMSKSLGNGVDPVDVINEYGTDALRMSVITGVGPGNDTRYFPEKCETMRNFCNKLWNASRFALMHVTPEDTELKDGLCLEDKWILTRLYQVIGEVTDNLERYELGVAAGKLYDFVWGELCDWYIELIKPRLLDGDTIARSVLYRVLTDSLKLLHPFIPYITEEIWQTLPGMDKAIIVCDWPKAGKMYNNEAAGMERVMDAIRAIRARRSELNVPPSKKAPLTIVTENTADFEGGKAYIARLAGASEITVTDTAPKSRDGLLSLTTTAAELFLPLAELVDLEEEKKRREKQLAKTRAEIKALEAKLANPGFTSKAPPQVVEGERVKLEELKKIEKKLL